MDISLLSKMVGELILKHDQVGLPGVGTFVAEMMPASFSDKGYTINPPYRRLNFYSANLEEDNLVEFYAETNGLDKDTAKSTICQFLAEFKVLLLDRRIVILPGLGRLRATKENNFFFVPNEDLDIFPEGYGLPPISLKTHVETPEEIALTVSNLADIIDVQTSKPVQEQAQEQVQEQAPVQVPVQEPEPEPEPDIKLAPEPRHFRWWMPIVILIGIAFIALCAFMLLAVVAPDFIDSILYTPQELLIINH